MTSSKYHAQRIYNDHFDDLCRQARENNQDLSLLLLEYLPSELSFFRARENYRFKPPDTSKMNQRNRELCLKEWYRSHFYEWIINEALWEHVDAQRLVLRGRKRGGNTRSEQKKLESSMRQAKIIQKENELIGRGITKNLNKLIVKALPEENYSYVQKFRAARKESKKSRC